MRAHAHATGAIVKYNRILPSIKEVLMLLLWLFRPLSQIHFVLSLGPAAHQQDHAVAFQVLLAYVCTMGL